MIIGVIVLFVILFTVLGMYNGLVKARNRVKQSASGIDVYLNQRFDLIPNLVECVKAYSKHESEIFEEVAELRESYKSQKVVDFEKAEEINNGLNQILAIAENYPDLKASEQYLNLQKSLVKIESQLQAARRIYNNDVTKYNTKIETVPTNLIAVMFGFKQESLFEIEEYKRENIDINIEE